MSRYVYAHNHVLNKKRIDLSESGPKTGKAPLGPLGDFFPINSLNLSQKLVWISQQALRANFGSKVPMSSQVIGGIRPRLQIA